VGVIPEKPKISQKYNKKLAAPLFGSSNLLVASSGGSNQPVSTLGGNSQLVAG